MIKEDINEWRALDEELTEIAVKLREINDRYRVGKISIISHINNRAENELVTARGNGKYSDNLVIFIKQHVKESHIEICGNPDNTLKLIKE